jgi:sulfate transport system ATP-binding protein
MSVAIEGVSKSFGPVNVLSDIHATVERNTLVALLGPSGCGKSTLLRIIAGLDSADRGRIRIDGNDVSGVPARRRGIGFVAQNYALFPHMTVADNIGFALEVRRAGRARTGRRVAELLQLVRLEGYESRLPRELSGGQKQRVALARALAAEPALLLLDEPFGALDLHVRRELRAWLRELHERTHVTTLLVTHDADEAMELADRIILLENGRIAQSGTPLELYAAPRTPFAMRFLGTANVLRGDDEAALYVRPHEFVVERQPFDGSLPASVRRVIALGSRTQLDVLTDDGQSISAEITNTDAQRIAPRAGERVYLAPRRAHTFAGAGSF